MVRLTVEESGAKRRFRLNEGTLTIGSGTSCTLTLQSEDIADVHAELEFHGGEATLKLRKGVAPARMRGKAVTGEVRMQIGVPVKIGSATLALEDESQKSSSKKTSGKKSPGRAGAVKTRAAATGSGSGEDRPERVDRQRRTVQASMPTWLMLMIFAGVCLAAWIGVKSIGESSVEEGFSPIGSKVRVEKLMRNAEYESAKAEAEKALSYTLTDSDRNVFENYLKEIHDYNARGRLAVYNESGTKYLASQLKKFESMRLKKSAEAPVVRVFLKRLNYFEATWPQHREGLGWVRRMRANYGPMIDLKAAPSLADIDFEVESLTWAKPREYRQAFGVIERFIGTASGGDKEAALAILDDMQGEQEEHFRDRMLQAKYEWEEKGQKGKAVVELASIVMRFADKSMEDEAAAMMVSLPRIDEYFRGYKNSQPHNWKRLIENEIIAQRARELGLD